MTHIWILCSCWGPCRWQVACTRKGNIVIEAQAGGEGLTQGEHSKFLAIETFSLFQYYPSTCLLLYLSNSTILLVARLSKSDKRIVAQHSVSSYLAAANTSPPSPSPVINGGGIVVRSLCRIAASERCLRRYSVSFRGDSAAESSEWPSSADKLAVTTTASKADEDDDLKGQCHQNCNLI